MYQLRYAYKRTESVNLDAFCLMRSKKTNAINKPILERINIRFDYRLTYVSKTLEMNFFPTGLKPVHRKAVWMFAAAYFF